MGIVEDVRALEHKRDYRAARALLVPELKLHNDDDLLRRRLAVCTYKDPDLPFAQRLDGALGILTDRVDGIPEDLTDQDSLGIAGAIFKRKWEVGGQQAHLHRSLALYRLGAEQGVAHDDGYTAINVAFVLDLLADLEQRQDPASPHPDERRTDAKCWREKIVDCLAPQLDAGKKLEWWPLVTIVEALVGLDRADDAQRWTTKAGEVRERSGSDESPMPWEIESTARQLAAIVRLRRDATDARAFSTSAAADRLRELVGAQWSAAVESAWTGKVGLALSGGGFRASLFHIGVLARLAELDVLRRVEVLSCVSGGSILGAYYYLKARELLEHNSDPRPHREDYLALVQAIELDFLEAIKSNLRVRLLTNPWRVFQMAISRNYTRTERAGCLYQKLLYSKLGNDDWRLPDLVVTPPGEDAGFKPKHDNWRRSSKVPMLVINATTMNTGHNWQFTATWMGEPPSAIDDDVDSADRLRRLYYHEAKPGDHQRTPLRRAVAASAAVPGMFTPMSLRELYPHTTVRLSDGGAHDNQGIASLIDQDCSVILVSDASGQGQSIVDQNDRAISILRRTMSVATARIRHAQYLDLAARRAASSLRGLMFVHLKKDLARADRTWIEGTPDPTQTSAQQRDDGDTAYGIRRDVQRKLASIRTDLDAFHDYEAYALMASGYRLVDHYFPQAGDGLPTTDGRHPWRFCAVQHAMEGGTGHATLLDKLRNSDRLFFKSCRWPGAMMGATFALLAALAIAALCAAHVIGGMTAVVVVLAGLVVTVIACAAPDDRLVVYLATLVVKVPLGLVAMLLAPLLAWPYLWTLNRLYLHNGRKRSCARVWGGV